MPVSGVQLRDLVEEYFREISADRLSSPYPTEYNDTYRAPDIENVPGLKLKATEDFANSDLCNICKQPFNQQRGVNRHHWYHFY